MQLMLTLFLKLTKIWQRENGKFVDFNDPAQVWRRPDKKRLWISTSDLYCQKAYVSDRSNAVITHSTLIFMAVLFSVASCQWLYKRTWYAEQRQSNQHSLEGSTVSDSPAGLDEQPWPGPKCYLLALGTFWDVFWCNGNNPKIRVE